MNIVEKEGRYFLNGKGMSLEVFRDNSVDRKFDYICEGLDDDDFSYFQNLSTASFPDNIWFHFYINNDAPFLWLKFVYLKKEREILHCKATYFFDWTNWNEDLHVNKLESLLPAKLNFLGCLDVESELDDGCCYININHEIAEEFTIYESLEMINLTFGKAIEEVLKEAQYEGFVTNFNFPPDSKHVFSMYLTYFGQFLEDLEIKCNSSVSTNGSQVTLNVVPENKEEAIDNIRFALTTYLALPTDPKIIKPNDDIYSQAKYQQLLATVDHLKGSLRLANSLVDVKEQEICLFQSNQKIPAAQSFSETHLVNNEVWEPIDGFKITKWKGKFYEIDLPKLAEKLGLKKSNNAILNKRTEAEIKVGDQPDSIVKRFIQLFENHGVHRNQIPRFFKHGLTVASVQNNESLLNVLTDDILAEACELFGVRREWLDGADQQAYDTYDFYKQPHKFLKFIKGFMNEASQGNLNGILLIPDSSDNHSRALLIIQETIGYIGDKPIYKIYLCNSWAYSYWKAKSYLTSCIAVAWKHGIYIQGQVIPVEKINSLSCGNELLGFDGEGIYAFNENRIFYPEDLALIPDIFLDGIGSGKESSEHISGLKLWLELDQQGFMDTGLGKTSAKKQFKAKLKTFGAVLGS